LNLRLNIVAAGHPHNVINLLQDESGNTSSDGFMSRFLISVPQPMRISLNKLIVLKNMEVSMLSKLFVTIKLVHLKSKDYKFTTNAFNYLSDCFDDYNIISEKHERKNPFLR
jgi:hypothetical protein